MDLFVQQPESGFSAKTSVNTLTFEANALMANLENHVGNKVKVSFIPNQYYNDKIYTLADYAVLKSSDGVAISMELKEGNIAVKYRIEDIVKIDQQEYFNRIEYKAYVGTSERYNDAYNFCLYF